MKESLSRLKVFLSFQTRTLNAIRRQERELLCVFLPISLGLVCGLKGAILGQGLNWLFQTHLKLNKQQQKSAEEVLAKYKQERKSVIGVHVRRTDYQKLLGGKYPHNPQFYKAAVDELRKRWGDLGVVVLSDDMGWCRQNILIAVSYTHLTLPTILLV